MSITFGDRLIDSGYHDITPEQEREIEAREECARLGLDPDDDAADAVAVWMVVAQEMRERRSSPVQIPCEMCAGSKWKSACPECDGTGYYAVTSQTCGGAAK